MSELQLIHDVLESQTEAEKDGVKYIYMDENTIYRFENNKMKKVSAALIKKAKEQKEMKKVKKVKKSKAPVEVEVEVEESKALSRYGEEEDSEQEEGEEQLEPVQPVKTKKPKQKKLQQRRSIPASQPVQDIDLNEYWQTKSKLEYQQRELERLNGKINKLKQYKSIVNRLTGSEYDQPETPPQIAESKRYNDSLFMF